MMTIGELGVSVAHEINQPLMAVVLNGDACLQWLATDPPNLEEAREAVGRIIDEGTRGGEIVRRIRTLSKMTSRQKTRLNLNEIINEAAALLDRELARNHVSFRTVLAKDLPPVLGDRVQLQQVIINLAVNAIEAMAADTSQPRELRIRSEVQEPDRAAGSVIVAIEDSGPGLPMNDPEQMFTAFFTTKSEGLGMGLPISRTIIEAQGGSLWASNSAGGAVFQFRIPVYRGANCHSR
jgi:C4-dicarboxylate-specific signal transduction histidine kinase